MNELMTRLDCMPTGVQSALDVPVNTSTWDIQDSWMYTGPPASSGVVVNPVTALRHSPVWACITAISGDMAGLDNEVARYRNESRERQLYHQVEWLLNHQPNDFMTPYQFKEALFGFALGWGNGIAIIVRDRSGRPVELLPVLPDRTYYTEYAPNEYAIVTRLGNQYVGRELMIDPRETVHLRAFTTNGFWGRSAVQVCREQIGNGIAQEQHGGATFRNGAKLSGILKLQKRMGPEDRQILREDWETIHSGSENSGRVGVLPVDVDWQSVAMSNQDAQWLESVKLDRNMVGMIFSVPPFRMQDYESSSVRANLEAQFKSYVRTSLAPWGNRWDQECARKLLAYGERRPTPRTGYVAIETNYDPLTRGTSDEIAKQATELTRGRLTTQNEGRRMIRLNPVPGGDTFSNPAIEPTPQNETETDSTEETETDTDEAVENAVRRQVSELIDIEVRRVKRNGKRSKNLGRWLAKFYSDTLPRLATDLLGPVCESAGLEYSLAVDEHVNQMQAGLQNGMDADWVAEQKDTLTESILRS